jgi:hypothetical protein
LLIIEAWDGQAEHYTTAELEWTLIRFTFQRKLEP